jgi:hypothetical protein
VILVAVFITTVGTEVSQPHMAELIGPTLALAGLLIATALYYLMVRRRARARHRRHAEAWDSALSQERAVRRFQDLEEEDRRVHD